MYHAISIMLWAFASLMRMPYVYFCTSKASKLRVPAYRTLRTYRTCTFVLVKQVNCEYLRTRPAGHIYYALGVGVAVEDAGAAGVLY